LLGGIERRWQALKDFEGTEATKFAGAGDAFKQARARMRLREEVGECSR
jgi:hypothetical protein